jgi:hypothetical protein
MKVALQTPQQAARHTEECTGLVQGKTGCRLLGAVCATTICVNAATVIHKRCPLQRIQAGAAETGKLSAPLMVLHSPLMILQTTYGNLAPHETS